MGQYPICGFTSKTNTTKGYILFCLESITMKALEILASLWYFLL